MDLNKSEHLIKPMVSVIVPTFNRLGMLADAIKSIRRQTYRPHEIIVVNDAGENVEDIVRAMNQDGTITYIRHKENKGLAACRNSGIRMAQGKYIAYLDDDDIFYPTHLETLVTFLENSGQRVAYTDACRAHQEKQRDGYVVTHRDSPFSFDFDYDRILYQNFVPVLCFMHQKNCLDVAGHFDESLKRHEDWDMWIRMSRKFEMSHIKMITCEYTSRQDGTTMTSGRKREFRISSDRIFTKFKALVKDKPEILKAQAVMRSALRGEEALEYAQEGDVSRGISLMEECLEFDSGNGHVHNILGKLYASSNNGSKALSHFKKALEFSGYSPDYQNDLDLALAHFCPAKKISLSKNCSSDIVGLIDLGDKQLAAGRLAEACVCFQKVIDRAPFHLTALNSLGVIALRSGQFDSSLIFFKQALEINPSHAPALKNIADGLRALEREEEAAAYLQRLSFLSAVQ